MLKLSTEITQSVGDIRDKLKLYDDDIFYAVLENQDQVRALGTCFLPEDGFLHMMYFDRLYRKEREKYRVLKEERFRTIDGCGGMLLQITGIYLLFPALRERVAEENEFWKRLKQFRNTNATMFIK